LRICFNYLRPITEHEGGQSGKCWPQATRPALRVELLTPGAPPSVKGQRVCSFNWPFEFQKFYLWEGGIRIPAMVRWPDVVPAGKVTNQAVLTMDWSATFLDVADVKADPAYPFDGESVMAVCAGKRPPFDRTVFWRVRARPQAAARMGKGKYLSDRGEEYLFDLAADPGEATDLKAKQPDTFEKVRAAYNNWNSTMLP